MKRFFREYLTWRMLLCVVAALLLGLGIYRWNAETIAGNRFPMPFGIGASVVLSGSMEPALSVNDLVIVKKTDEFAVGQVVVYQDGTSLTVHRIVAIEGDTLITQGDANNAADEPISMQDVKGEVILAIPFVGLLVDFFQEPIVIILLLAATVFLMERSFRVEKENKYKEVSDLRNEIAELMKEMKDYE